jgi:hypothetical protein
VQINQEFGGNDRYLYPPIRPPIEEDSPRKTGRPNIAEATNAALAKWYGALEHQSQQQRIAPAHPGPHQFLNNAPPAALHLPELERFVGLGSSGAALDPQSFADPECQVHSLDINMVAPNDLTQKYRLLPKRGVSRRLNAQPAGIGYASEASCCNGLVAARSIQVPRVPISSPAIIKPLQPSQVDVRGTRRLTPSSSVVVLRRPSPAQVTSMPSTGLPVLLTPVDMRYLDFVLDGRVSPDDPADWVRRMLSDLERRSSPGSRTVGYAVYPYQWTHLLCAGNSPGGRTGGSARGESLEVEAGEDGELVTTGAGLTPPAERPELQEDTVEGAGGQDTASPRSDETTVTHRRRKRRGGRRQRAPSDLTPAAVAGPGGGSHNPRSAQTPSPSQALLPENAPGREESMRLCGEVTADLPPQPMQDSPAGSAREAPEVEGLGGSTQGSGLPGRPVGVRRRGRGKRRGSTPPPLSTAGGLGGSNPRGVQPLLLEVAAASCASTDHGPWAPPALEEGTTASCGSTDDGKPTSVSAAPIDREQGGLMTLSERSEFRQKRRARRESGLVVSVTSGHRGRRSRRVEILGRSPPPSSADSHLQRRVATDFSGLGKALARMGVKGLLSTRAGSHSYSGDDSWGNLVVAQGTTEEQAGPGSRPPPEGSGVANTASWVERNKRRREGAHLSARCKMDGTFVPEDPGSLTDSLGRGLRQERRDRPARHGGWPRREHGRNGKEVADS